MTNKKNDVRKIKDILKRIERDLSIAQEILARVSSTEKPDYAQVAGVEGIFDGQYMVTKEGEKHEVPANYAAKSRLIYGDGLKMVEEEGSLRFKHMVKLPHCKIEATLDKKDGKWFAVAAEGTYKVSERAAEFNGVKTGDKVVVVVPEGNLSVPFAALEKVLSVAVVPSAPTPEPVVVKSALSVSASPIPIKRRARTVKKKEVREDTAKESVISLEDEDLR